MNKKFSTGISNKLIGCAWLMALVVIGCSEGPVVYDKENLLAFYKEHRPANQEFTNSSNDKLDVYIDYSSGMYEPIQQMDEFYSFFFTIIQDDKTNFFKVGEDSLSQIDKKDVIENVVSPYYYKNVKNYDENESRMRDAIEEITRNKNKQSLFISDFELFEGTRTEKPTNCGTKIKTGINNTAWAKEEFSIWLQNGNFIDVYAHPFMLEDSARYLYFILFSPASVSQTEDLSFLRNRMQLEGYHRQNNEDVEWFSFSNKDFGLETPSQLDPKFSSGAINQFSKDGMVYSWYEYQMVQHLKKTKDEPIIHGVWFKDNSTIYDDYDFEIIVYDVKNAYEKYKLNSTEERTLVTDHPFSLIVQKENNGRYDLGMDFNPMEIRNANDVNLYQVEFWVKDAKKILPKDRMQHILGWVDPRCLPIYSLKTSLEEAAARLDFEKEYLFSIFFEIHR